MADFLLSDVLRQKMCFSPLKLSHSKKHGGGGSKFWQVIPIATTALGVIKLSPLLQRLFFLSIRHLCLRVFHYFKQNICHGF